MSENPFTKKGRIFWKQDPEFQKFNKRLYDEYFTFDEVFELSTLKSIIKFKDTVNLEKVKQEWNDKVNEWNKIDEIEHKNKGKGFVALTYLMYVLPYDDITNIEIFSEMDMEFINIIYFYVTDGSYLNYTGATELFDSGPMFPPAYQEWIDQKYNSASWWISYRIYERINKLEPLIDSKPTKRK